MSANPKPDLEQIKTAFENFRAGRSGKERLPENLWAQAITLLEHYPLRVVCRQLRLKPDYLSRRATAAKGVALQPIKNKPKFLTLTSSELTQIKNEAAAAVQSASSGPQCRLQIERGDGSRLQLNLPVDGFSQTDWSRIEDLCASFLRG